MPISKDVHVYYGVGLVPVQFYLSNRHNSKELVEYCLKEGWIIKDFTPIDNKCNGIKEILEFIQPKLKDIKNFIHNKSVFIHINRAPIIANVPGEGLMAFIEMLKINTSKCVLTPNDV